MEELLNIRKYNYFYSHYGQLTSISCSSPAPFTVPSSAVLQGNTLPSPLVNWLPRGSGRVSAGGRLGGQKRWSQGTSPCLTHLVLPHLRQWACPCHDSIFHNSSLLGVLTPTRQPPTMVPALGETSRNIGKTTRLAVFCQALGLVDRY